MRQIAGIGCRQLAGDLDAQALARFVLDDPECAFPDICPFEFQDIRRPLAGYPSEQEYD